VFFVRHIFGVRQFGNLDGGEAMKMTRWLMVAALGMLCCTWAQADGLSDFLINLEGWDNNQEFTFIGNAQVPTDTSPCLPSGSFCFDASIKTNNGGGSTPEYSTTWTFNADQVDEFGNIYFDNDSGVTFTTVEISAILNADEDNLPFTCDGGVYFASCGFVFNDAPDTLQVYFYNAYAGEGIPTATPEPSQWLILLIALAAMIVVRIRKGSVSSSFAQTQRTVCPTRDS
jgi:hypothetical protein